MKRAHYLKRAGSLPRHSTKLACKFRFLSNLVAISALTSPLAPGRRLKPGDEVITCAAGFPTTVFPIIQAGLVPVFVDNDPLTGNIDISMLEGLTPS